MIVADTSALIAVVTFEAEAEAIIAAMAQGVAVSAATLVEGMIVMHGRAGEQGVRDLVQLLDDVGAEIAPFTEAQARLAGLAHQRFGKGRHPAGLNFGDCFSYALAVSRGAPLLFKGEDFAKTDVKRAL